MSFQVASSTDDAEEDRASGGMYLVSTDLELVTDSTSIQSVGIRFANVQVPQGATITSAHLSFAVDESQSDPTSLSIVGQAADNSATFSYNAHDVSGRPKTIAQVRWDNLPPWTTSTAVESPDLSPIVQEVVSRPGWTPGNALSLVVDGSGHRTAVAYDGSSANAPKLVITYLGGAALPTMTPTVAPTRTAVSSPTATPTSGSTGSPTPTSTASTATPTPMVNGSLRWRPYLQQPSDSSVVVLWTSVTNAEARVYYSTDWSFAQSAVGTTTDWSSAYAGVFRHRVVLGGLSANTTYHYKVYVGGVQYAGPYSFTTAPTKGSSTSFSFVSVSDFGVNASGEKAVRDSISRDPSWRLLVTAGDNEQNDGAYGHYSTNVFGVYTDVFSRGGVAPVPGNHDYNTASGAAYYDIFDLPASGSNTEHHYSFDYGNVHFVMLSAPDEAFQADAAWLDADLAATTQRWKVVIFHYPAYSTGVIHGSDSRVDQYWVPIFERRGVSLVVNGHDHIYERTCPLKGGVCTSTAAGGVVYVVRGTGEAVQYDCDAAASWDAYRICTNVNNSYTGGLYGRYTVTDSAILVETVDVNGLVRDSYSISSTQ